MIKSDERRCAGKIVLAACMVVLIVFALLALSFRFASPAFDVRNAALAFILMQPLAFFAIWIQGARLAALAGPPCSVSAAFWANVLSSVSFLVTPGRISEALKPVALNLLSAVPLVRGFAAVALERLLDVGCLALMTFLALLGTATKFSGQLSTSAWSLAVLFGGGATAVLFLARRPALTERLVGWLPTEWLRRMSSEVMAVLRHAGQWSMLIGPIAYTVLTWLASYVNLLLLVGIAGPIELSPLQVLFVFVAGILGMVVTVTPGGLGTYEAAVVVALAQFGYPVADGLAIAVILRAATVLPAIPCAIWFLGRSGLGFAGLLARTESSTFDR